MSEQYKIPKNLINPFKVLTYQILAYGEEFGYMTTYIDSYGENNIAYEVFKAGSDNYNNRKIIKIPQSISDFFEDICGELPDIYGEYDYDNSDGYTISFIVDAENKKLRVNFTEYYKEESPEGAQYSYDEILERFPQFDELIDGIKHIGKVVVITYDGGGDSGWIDQTYSSQDDDISETLTGNLYENFEEILYSMLSSNFGSWGDNEGSRGKIIIDTQKKEIYFDHINYYQESNTKESVRVYDLTSSE